MWNDKLHFQQCPSLITALAVDFIPKEKPAEASNGRDGTTAASGVNYWDLMHTDFFFSEEQLLKSI